MEKTIAKKNAFVIFFKKLGPGIITGASDDDPSGIATYSQAGTQFGLATLWMAFITFPLMFAIQEMCARIGMVTAHGLTSIIKKHYSKSLLIFVIVLTVPAVIFNIAADIASMSAVANMVFPSIPINVYSVFFTLVLMLATIILPYQKIVMVLKYFCLSLLLYLIIPFLSEQHWINILKNTFIPTIQFNKEFLNLLIAILGTTVSPYMFFWQATMGAETRRKIRDAEPSSNPIKEMRYDVFIGMFLSNLVMYFIIWTTGTILFQHGIEKIETVEQAAKALEPLAGKLAYFLFALGVIGTGALAIPVLCGTVSYMLATFMNWTIGLDKTFYRAKGFYSIIIVSMVLALVINLIGINPIKALIWTAILYGVTAPVMIWVVLHIANSKTIMKEHVNGRLSNSLGVITLIFMSLSSLLFLYFQLFP